MEKKILPAIVLILIAGAIAYWKLSNPIMDKPVAPDTYIVWSATRETTDRSVDDTPGADVLYTCDAFAYRYAIGAEEMLQLDRITAEASGCDYPYSFVPATELVYTYSDYRLNLNGKKFAWEDPGKLGVEGYGTGELHVYSEYMMPDNDTIVTLVPREGESTQFTIQNENYISRPYYLSPIAVSDDGTQIYFGEFTEASGSLRFGIHVHVYNVAVGSMTRIAYGNDLLVSDFVFDTAGKRMLVISGTRQVNEEAPGWDEVIGPSQLHLVDLVTGKGKILGVETTDEAILTSPRFSPVNADTFSAESNGVTHMITVDADGLITDGNDITGRIVDWTDDILVLAGPSRYMIFDPTGKIFLGATNWADFDLTDGSFGFQYLGSATISE